MTTNSRPLHIQMAYKSLPNDAQSGGFGRPTPREKFNGSFIDYRLYKLWRLGSPGRAMGARQVGEPTAQQVVRRYVGRSVVLSRADEIRSRLLNGESLVRIYESPEFCGAFKFEQFRRLVRRYVADSGFGVRSQGAGSSNTTATSPMRAPAPEAQQTKPAAPNLDVSDPPSGSDGLNREPVIGRASPVRNQLVFPTKKFSRDNY
jgi:hypothetical protein